MAPGEGILAFNKTDHCEIAKPPRTRSNAWSDPGGGRGGGGGLPPPSDRLCSPTAPRRRVA
jgi:hypothetical protein